MRFHFKYICSLVFSEYNYKDVCVYKLQQRTLSKLIKRLAKAYNLLESDAMPNVMKIKKYGQLQFLLHKNYNEKSLSMNSFISFIYNILPEQ